MIKVVTTIEEFTALESRWNEMMAQCSTATPYQVYALCKLCWEMWKCPGDLLYIICHHKKEEWPIDAIFPCYLRYGVLRWIDFHSDFCSPIEVVPFNERYEMYSEVVQHINSNPGISMVKFSRVPADSPMLGYFNALGGYSKIQVSNAFSVIPLNLMENDPISAISTLVKQKQRKIRDIDRENQTTYFYDVSFDPYPKKDIQELADHMVDEGMRNVAYMSPHFLSYFEQLYAAGVVKVLVSYDSDDKSPLASFFLLHDTHRNELIEWVLLYKCRRHNLQLMIHLLKIMHSLGIDHLNMACGIYNYKLHNFHPEVHNVCCLRMWRTHAEVCKCECCYFIRAVTSRFFSPFIRLLRH